MEENNSLIIFTRASQMLAEADTIQKAKELKNLALTAADWAKRKGMGEEALRFQDYVVDLMLKELGLCISNYSSRYYQQNYGENRQGIEIKLDTRILETGNVSIEVAEKSKAINKNWINSGIMREDNTWLYVQGNYEIVFVFTKNLLRGLYESRYKLKVWEPNETIRTFLLPISEARKYAAKIFEKIPSDNS